MKVAKLIGEILLWSFAAIGLVVTVLAIYGVILAHMIGT